MPWPDSSRPANRQAPEATRRSVAKLTSKQLGPAGIQVITLAPWFVVGLLALFINLAASPTFSQSTGPFLFSGLSLLLGSYLFMRGGPQIDANAIMNYSFFTFVGIASAIALFRADEVSLSYVAVALCYFAQLAMASMFVRPKLSEQLRVEARDGKWLVMWGTAYLAAGILLAPFESTLGPVPSAMAFVGAALVAIGAVLPKGRAYALRVVVTLTAVAIYIVFIFTGFGRLTVVSLLVVVAIAMSVRARTYWVKFVLLAATFPALSFLASFQGLGLADQTWERGDGSALAPIIRLDELVSLFAGGSLTPTWGRDYLVSLVALVPRAVWPDKPSGLGSELAYVFSPEYAEYGHSDVASVHGESLYNFGFLGIFLLALVLGFACNWLSGRLSRLNSCVTLQRRQLLSFTVVCLASAGIADLYWAGTFTYMVRTGSRVLVLLPLVLLLLFESRRQDRGDRPAKQSAELINTS